MTGDDDQKPGGHKIGGEKLCRITSRAANQVTRWLTSQDRPDDALRIAVVGGGASGFKYKIELVEGPTPKDILINSQGIKLVVDSKSALFISGSIVDWNAETSDFQIIPKFR